MSIEIPESGREALARLLTASPDFLNALCESLAKAKPTLFWSDSAIEGLSASLQRFPAGNSDSLRSILRMLMGVLSWTDGDHASEIASELIDSAKASRDDRLKGKGEEDWKRLAAFLEQALAIEPLSISAKALQLFRETPKHMHTARVLTDARPIFTKAVDDGPTGFVIVHTLRLEYAEAAEDDREFFISVDTGDLEALKGAVERALQKERSLRAMLEKTELPIITYPKS